MRRAEDYFHCPECGKKGVTLRLGAEDHWACQYCDWFAFAWSPDTIDVERYEALRKANEGKPNVGELYPL